MSLPLAQRENMKAVISAELTQKVDEDALTVPQAFIHPSAGLASRPGAHREERRKKLLERARFCSLRTV